MTGKAQGIFLDQQFAPEEATCLGQCKINSECDWYEFLVVEDLLDLRGWTIQLWDRDRTDDLLDRAASLTFAAAKGRA